MDTPESLSGPTSYNFWDWAWEPRFLTHSLRNAIHSEGGGGEEHSRGTLGQKRH